MVFALETASRGHKHVCVTMGTKACQDYHSYQSINKNSATHRQSKTQILVNSKAKCPNTVTEMRWMISSNLNISHYKQIIQCAKQSMGQR